MNRDLNAVHFVDGDNGWAAGDRGMVLHTNDGGATWTTQITTINQNINDIYFRNEREGFFLAGNRLYTTTTGGVAWREARRFSATDFDGAMPELYSIVFAGRKGWIVGSVARREMVVDSLVLCTDDGGQTWTRQLAPVRDELIDLDFVSDERGWIVGAGGTVLHTRDGGRTWTAQRSGTNATLYSVEFRGRRDGWAVGERGAILRTTNGGERWSAVATMLPGMPNRTTTLLGVKFTSDDEGFIVGRGGLILRSGDSGQTWIRQESRTSNHLYALATEGRKNGWAVGGGGIVLQYRR